MKKLKCVFEIFVTFRNQYYFGLMFNISAIWFLIITVKHHCENNIA